jgi:hypothetical protein
LVVLSFKFFNCFLRAFLALVAAYVKSEELCFALCADALHFGAFVHQVGFHFLRTFISLFVAAEQQASDIWFIHALLCVLLSVVVSEILTTTLSF